MQSLGKCWLIAVALNNLLWVQLTHVLLLRYIQAANLSNDEFMGLFLFCISFCNNHFFTFVPSCFILSFCCSLKFVHEFNGHGAFFFNFSKKTSIVHSGEKLSYDQHNNPFTIVYKCVPYPV